MIIWKVTETIKGTNLKLTNRFMLAADACQHANYLRDLHPDAEIVVDTHEIKSYEGPCQEKRNIQ